MSLLKHNPVGWFELPVTDLDRAKQFYETVFDIEMPVETIEQVDMAFFPMQEDGGNGASGALVYNEEMYDPSEDKGPLLYFSCPEAGEMLRKIRAAGGKTIVDKTLIREDIGYMAIFLDSEGNRVALHSRE